MADGSAGARQRHRPRRSAAGRAKIFARFYRGEKSGKSPGHGLGLSIAQTIAHLHGFKLTVEDNDPGARFDCAPSATPRRCWSVQRLSGLVSSGTPRAIDTRKILFSVPA